MSHNSAWTPRALDSPRGAIPRRQATEEVKRTMWEPSCPNCLAEKFRGHCSACGLGTFPAIDPIEAAGLKLKLVEVRPSDDDVVYRQFLATLVLSNGEVREQTVAGQRFARGWRDTAARRMTGLAPDCLTPQVIVSMKWNQ